jgi:secreted trypsin-like serine protease
MEVKKVIRHGDYDKDNFLNDISIYKLKTPVELNQFVQPACLPNPDSGSSQPPTNAYVFASGWVT